MATLLITAAINTAIAVGLSYVRAALTPDVVNRQEGARLKQSQFTTSTEGTAIPRHWGRSRIGGNIVWSTRFKETKTTKKQSNGGKGGTNKQTSVQTTYTYSVSFAVGFCEGNDRVQLGRVWVDGKLLDLANETYRFYQGTESQTPDTLIQTVEGSEEVSAFRGTCYMVFEDMQLESYGNRIPQITAEIIKGPKTLLADDIESLLRGVALIPASGEFSYGTREYVATGGGNLAGGSDGNSKALNVHNHHGIANLLASLDDLEATAPDVDTINLVISWFGDDLRVGDCTIEPRVEGNVAVRIVKAITPQDWACSGLTRSTANSVSTDADGNFNYGGTPADVTVREAIIELKSRGFKVMFYPFILMDITASNSLPDPYSDNAATVGQSSFPWRGRLTASPAPGYAGTVDQTAAAATQVAAFTGTCTAGHFGSWNGSTIPYSGPSEFTYRRMILHYAKLCADLFTANDVFIIGSELVGLTTTRSSATAYPFVDDLVALAGDVSGILGSGRLVSYAADWSEYHSHRPDGNTVNFNLDPLWSSTHIDFIGIDNYLPMSDWRDGFDHLDYQAGYKTIYNAEYLQSNIEGGEYYDWFYASEADRASQTRTAITDGLGKPWVFRNKDIRNWWANPHYNRAGAVEAGSSTAWTAESKPVWFTEFGCPGVDKGTNQPNVFVDPKSSESFFPHFSSETRDDLIQRRYLEEMLIYWRDNAPTSSVYSDKMVKPANMLAWTWDARPFPQFPYRSDIWSDAANYKFGHWLNGRLPMITLPAIVTEICELVGFDVDDLVLGDLFGPESVVRGFTVDEVASPRSMIEMLMGVYHFDAYASEGKIKFSLRAYPETVAIELDDLVTTDDNPGGYALTRGQETELPGVAKVTFYDESSNYQVATVDAIKQTGRSENVASSSVPVVIAEAQARAIPYRQLAEAWTARESGKLGLPPSRLALDPGDVLSVPIKGQRKSLRINGFDTAEFREASVHGFDVANYDGLSFDERESNIPIIEFYGPSLVEFADLPMFSEDTERPWVPRVYGYQAPWPGSVAVYEDDNAGGYYLNTAVVSRSVIGETSFDFAPGPTDVWDNANELTVDVYSDDQILGSTDLAVLNGVNIVAVENADGGWEVLQYVNATLVSTKRYKLTRLLRGQGGTEGAMRDPVAAGARVIFISLSEPYSLDVPISAIFQDRDFRYGPATANVGNFRFQDETVTIGAVGLRPYSPVHVRGEIIAGDWVFSWVRRTRIAGDSWVPESVPLNEDFEAYEVDVMDGATVARTINTSSPSVVYTAAMQTADFGSAQSSITIRVYQMSVLYGRGEVREATLND